MRVFENTFQIMVYTKQNITDIINSIVVKRVGSYKKEVIFNDRDGFPEDKPTTVEYPLNQWSFEFGGVEYSEIEDNTEQGAFSRAVSKVLDLSMQSGVPFVVVDELKRHYFPYAL